MKTANRALHQLLAQDLPPLVAKLEQRALSSLASAWQHWLTLQPAEQEKSRKPHQLLSEFLPLHITSLQQELSALRGHYADFARRYSNAANRIEQQTHLLEFARQMGQTPRGLRQDRRALRRWLDRDALTDRYRRRQAGLEKQLSFALERLAVAGRATLAEIGPQRGYEWIWRRLDMEKFLTPWLIYTGDPRVRIAAFKCLGQALRQLPGTQHETYIGADTLRYVYRVALDAGQDAWLQCEALSLLADLSLSRFLEVAEQRLRQPKADPDLFVRQHIGTLLTESVTEPAQLDTLLALLMRDPSPFVRQGLAERLLQLPVTSRLQSLLYLIGEDPSAQVRASAVLQLAQWADADSPEHELQLLGTELMSRETDPFVLRVSLRAIWQRHARLLDQQQESAAADWLATLAPLIEDLHQTAPDLAVRRWAAQSREQLWAQASAERRALLDQLQMLLADIQPGRRKRWRKQLSAGVDEMTLGRLLAISARGDFGWDVNQGLLGRTFYRAQRLGFRSWRWLHELRHSATDKRQAFSHVCGRVYRGTLRAPSTILAELAQTKVPGEPVYMPTEDGWRPYLPLPDELLSCIDHSKGLLTIYSAEGITAIQAPRSLYGKLKARWLLTWRFSDYAHRRNWQEGSQTEPTDYIQAIQQLGFTVRLQHYPDEPASQFLQARIDPAVSRFFPAFLPLADPVFWQHLRDYFFSVYENSLQHLALFLALMSGLFFGRHWLSNQRVRRARRRIPLVIGGWGTRGKSGTERLKAALFNALGSSVLSKTTGCEAMFLYGYPFGDLTELFLFRPYDKATIWEQTQVLRLADRLDGDVLLWECMGLGKDFVHVLQRQWMRDDLATITNTYPDHEDVQGPAGYNIPEVMTAFIPAQATLLTSEEQMLPILRSAAQQLDTHLRTVNWLEAGLLTPDILARFPYQEHPYNIALVLALADELGISSAYALKEMADRVVADLGVLKTYPTAPVHNRRLSFVNGMSANERFGCLGNWQRMGFAEHDPYATPGEWITTVVNNRADRIPRSRVFASILVADISADRHVLIGTNLTGLQRYIRDSWDEYSAAIHLWPDADTSSQANSTAVATLIRMARRQRVPLQAAHLHAELRIMLAALGVNPDETALAPICQQPDTLSTYLDTSQPDYQAVAEQLRRQHTHWQQYETLKDRIQHCELSKRAACERDFQQLLWDWFSAKLIVVDDPLASGEHILHTLWQRTPPGFHNRIMGIQNIKGTGLDFIYRWQDWEICYHAANKLLSDQVSEVNAGLRTLSGFQGYGQLCAEYLTDTLEKARHQPAMQSELQQAELAQIRSDLATSMNRISGQLHQQRQAQSMLERLAARIEPFLDAGDAVRRRKRADRIYRDLLAERISLQRTAQELQAVNKRQKGGWLAKKIRDRLLR